MYGERFRKFVDESREKVWFSFLLNLLTLAVMLLLMTPAFETNDDTTMREFVNGARQSADPHIVFQHFFLGICYRLLYLLPGNLPWYTIVQYTVLLLSFTAVTWVVLRRLRGPAGFCVAAVLLIYFGKECYIIVQFTKTASVATCAGILLLFHAVESGSRHFGRMFLSGLALGCIGFMYRSKQSLACTALMTGIGLFLVLKMLRGDRKGFVRGLFPYGKVFGVFLLCILALKVTDTLVYQMDDRWAESLNYSDLRSDLLDYGIPNYDENQELYTELGINRDAWKLYASWNFYDPDKLSVEVIERLLEVQARPTLCLALAKNFLKEFPLKYFQTYTFYGFLLLGVFWFFCGFHRREDNLAVLYEIVLFGLLYFYMYYNRRYFLNRVDAGLWFALALTAFWFLDESRMEISGRLAGLICLGLLALNQNNWKDHWHLYHTGDAAARDAVKESFETIRQDKEHLYLTKIGLLSGFNAYGIFERMPEGVLDNLCLLGGWDCNIPAALDIMSAYGVTNPYRDMVDNPSVCLIDNDIDLTLRYIREYYAPDAQAVLVKEIGDRSVYRIVTEEETQNP